MASWKQLMRCTRATHALYKRMTQSTTSCPSKDTTVILISGKITLEMAEKVQRQIESLSSSSSEQTLVIVLHTTGGSAFATSIICHALHQFSGKISEIYIPFYAISGGTMIVLCALRKETKLIMGRTAYLTPCNTVMNVPHYSDATPAHELKDGLNVLSRMKNRGCSGDGGGHCEFVAKLSMYSLRMENMVQEDVRIMERCISNNEIKERWIKEFIRTDSYHGRIYTCLELTELQIQTVSEPIPRWVLSLIDSLHSISS